MDPAPARIHASVNGPLRVLVIDDEEAVQSAIQSELEEAGGDVADGLGDAGWEVHSQGFDGVAAALGRMRPDLVVLDLVEGQITDEAASGNRSFEHIRDNWFCPVVVYTGFGEVRTFQEHPQVVQVTKGMDSEMRVLAELQKFAPLAHAIRAVHDDFDARIREALRDSVEALGRQSAAAADELPDDSLGRAVRRQVAARVDFGASAGRQLSAWERLVVPPLGDDLLTADLLRRRDAEWANPAAFRLALTPSCDMVRTGGREPRAGRILVAVCEPVRKLGQVELKAGKHLSGRASERLRSILTRGMAGEHLIIPGFN